MDPETLRYLQMLQQGGQLSDGGGISGNPDFGGDVSSGEDATGGSLAEIQARQRAQLQNMQTGGYGGGAGNNVGIGRFEQNQQGHPAQAVNGDLADGRGYSANPNQQYTGTSGEGSGDASWFGGDLQNVGQSARTNLGEMPGQVAGQFSDPFFTQYGGNTDYFTNKIANAFGGFPTAQAAQLDVSQLPQAHSTDAGGSDALSFLLSGQGFDPKTLAAMNAGVTDNAAATGRSQAGNARLMAEQNGISGSPAQMALESAARRNQGAMTQQGLNDVQIQNAHQGMTNLTQGAGMQQQLNLSNAQQANMMALQNVQNIIQGMNQNVAMTQQANMANFSAAQQSAMAKSEAQAGFQANAGQGLNNAMLNKQTNADTTNATNKNNWAINQGNLDQNNKQFNVGVGENRWSHSLDALGQLVNGTNAQGYDANATQALASQGVGTSAAGNALVDIGSGILGNVGSGQRHNLPPGQAAAA